MQRLKPGQIKVFLTNWTQSVPTAKENLGVNFIGFENHKVKLLNNETVSHWLKKLGWPRLKSLHCKI